KRVLRAGRGAGLVANDLRHPETTRGAARGYEDQVPGFGRREPYRCGPGKCDSWCGFFARIVLYPIGERRTSQKKEIVRRGKCRDVAGGSEKFCRMKSQ